jgi:hypothetical protein
MPRKPFTPLIYLSIGFILSILSFFILIFLVKFFGILYTKNAPPGSLFYFKILVDFAAFPLDFTNPVTDVCIMIAIILLGILYSFALRFFKRNPI